ncbi:hypothetical protein [Halomarina rubra]|uniref:Uncharacterized protein n=1 Tax=Halomarina rubra TaxID=2071873 RepID=A0ABD6B0V7_9EURY|nr:hypothetical protein [Halomarina rubra]
MVNRRKFLYFVMFIVGVTMLLSGVLGWFIFADKDYSIIYEYSSEDAPAGVSDGRLDVDRYDSLDEQQRADFERAVDGEVIKYDDSSMVWAEAIDRNGTYYVFSTGGKLDWFDPATSGSAVLGLVGLVTVVQAARLEHRLY